ncbi:site-2 protease family protein [Cohnella panacarvi]|uniref:site-2 protease family protein n=1 Tax=Cohnella panacarvi TaxID=400776 RepID=UPI00047DBB21|nr:site-2 protease family protein [Cohnella panacarvi]
MKAKTRSTLTAIGVFLLAKFKWVIALLKWSKFGGTLFSMAASLSAYALFFGWKFAIAIVYLIFVHEMGHLVAARHKGIATSPAMFIPFVGAMISMKERPRDAATEAYLAYGGPLAGLLSFLPAVLLYQVDQVPFWALVIYLGATINLFNLLPVSPLDGGRIVSVLSTKIWLFGLAALLALVVAFPDSPMMYVILLIGIFSWWNRAREGYRSEVLGYEKEKLERLAAMLRDWPKLTSTLPLKMALAAEAEEAMKHRGKLRKWSIPFLHDKEKFAREKAEIDLNYVMRTRELLQEWEHQPVLYEDGDPDRPVPSELLEHAVRKAEADIAVIQEEQTRYRTYYKSSSAVKWKVLIAYLLLAGVLSGFMLYGYRLMELYTL